MKNIIKITFILFGVSTFLQCRNETSVEAITPAPLNDKSSGNHFFITNTKPQNEILEKISRMSGTSIEKLEGIRVVLDRLFHNVPEHMLQEGYFQFSDRLHPFLFSAEKKWLQKRHKQIKALNGELYIYLEIDYEDQYSTNDTTSTQAIEEIDTHRILVSADTIEGNSSFTTLDKYVNIPVKNHHYDMYLGVSFMPHPSAVGNCQGGQSCKALIKIGHQASAIPF